jgi:hypothetical protein
MNKKKYMNVTLFDSPDLRVGVNVVNTKKLDDKEINLVYETNDGLAINPSVFLTFGFKNGDGTFSSAYLSFPHIRNLRETMFRIVNQVSNYEITKPFGHDKHTLSFTKNSEFVIVELTDSNKVAKAGAPLTIDSFSALEGVIMDLDLTTIMVMAGLAYLQADDAQPQQQPLPLRSVEKEKPLRAGYVKPNASKSV